MTNDNHEDLSETNSEVYDSIMKDFCGEDETLQEGFSPVTYIKDIDCKD